MDIILTVNYSPWSRYSGGGQRSTHNLGLSYSERGHDVTVVYTKPPWEQIKVPADLPYQVRWATFFGLWSRRAAPLRPLNAYPVARTVRDVIQEADEPVVVQCNGEEGARIPDLRPDLDFGLVATPRYSEYPAALMQKEPLSAWTRVRLFLTEHKYLAQGDIARKADRSVPPSAYAARMLHDAYGIPDDRLDVVHNGVPREFLEYDHDPAAVEEGPLVFFGRFAKHKGVDTLIEALEHLGDDAPPTRIVGRGVLEDELRTQIDRLHLNDRISFHPWMTHHELGEALREARMAVLPSREENFSLAILSALAVGTPTISTDVGGTPEIIDDGNTGLLVPADDPPALADAIHRLQSNPDDARRIGASGQSHVRNHLTWAVAAEQFETLFGDILQERGLSQASQPL
ncbi:MAG: hypothetical protein BRD55_06925 [Bacteroidetes bacterium SW_9_63_38]|nr:MAG: hypothetical protein BRD55_06925 [Bacteroidetes bacterium SW_9_63_38]